MRFSDRYGITKVREVFQTDHMSSELRIAIWNVMTAHLWLWADDRTPHGLRYDSVLYRFCIVLWSRHFKQPIDQMPVDWYGFIKFLRNAYFDMDWWETYNLLEHIVQTYPRDDEQHFIEHMNGALADEMSAYRIVDESVVKITDETEIDAIQAAIDSPIDLVRTQLRRALELLADREQRDYRNSVKESISAVESLAGRIVSEKDSLGPLIKRLQETVNLHPAFAKGLSNLYGYTSDAKGIRHALMESEAVTFDEAKFFLVICSAFVNFIVASVPPAPEQ